MRTVSASRTGILMIAGGIILLGMLVAVVVVRHRSAAGVTGTDKITVLGGSAFGDLSLSSLSGLPEYGAASTGSGAGDLSQPVAVPSMGAALQPGSKMFASATYSYAGPAVSQDQATVGVFRRVEVAGPAVASYLRSTGFTQVDLGKLSGAKLRSIQISDGSDSYNLQIDYRTGQIYMNLDPETGATAAQPTASPDLPKEKVLAIARDFIGRFGISTAGYGAPQVVSDVYPSIVPLMAPAADAYGSVSSPAGGASSISLYSGSVATVMYPMRIDGKPVYDYSGSPVGLTFQIDQRTERVSGMYGLSLSGLEESQYPAETSAATIMAKAAAGGILPAYSSDSTAPIGLDAPELSYVSTSQAKGGTVTDLYVPALAFPVSAADANNTYLKRVMVLLVKDTGQGGQPVPLPIMNSGSSGSAPVSR